MRYEDASSSFDNAPSGTPDARNDADAVAAGSRGPATGNAITGAGTISGIAGADSVTNGPAQIVALEGAGGSDTTDGGTLHVQGRFGELTMDSRGGYSYKPNDASAEGGRDIFRYTLADGEGARDTATLTIDLGRELEKVDANAQQIIPGPDGVVTLPPGVQLSDVHVVGRNLIIAMPDGSQMVIVDGAVFVPQLVLGGVEVPATNLAALLIDAEPKPAAGVPLSGGGNFAVDIPALDPGVPLGDLIPPTELAFAPPTFEEVNQFDDEEPGITIEPDGQPASVAAVDSVDEAGLPTRNGEPAGSGESADGDGANASDDSESTTGVINVSSPDGIASLIILDGDGNPVDVTGGGLVHGEFGELGVSLTNGVYSYVYTLRDNTAGDATHEDFSVTLTDDDGDTATATLTINIADDVPGAANDVDALDAESLTADGNVMSGADTTTGADGADTVGADDADVTGIRTGTSGEFTVVADAGTEIPGLYGTLTIYPDGHYDYEWNRETSDNVTEVFTYQLTDGDGDPDTATLSIAIPNINDAPVALDDSHWTQEGAGAISGNVLVSAAHDGAPDAASRGDVADSDVDGDDLDVSLDGPAVGSYGTLTSFDPASGAYSYQVDNANPLVEALGVGESLTETYSYTVSDGEGGSDTGQLTITIFGTNDAPVALDDSHWTQEGAGAISGNVLVSAAHDGAPDAASRGDVADSDVDGDDLDVSLDGPAVGSYGTLTSFDPASGAYSYQVDNANPLVEALGVGESLTETYSYTVSDGEGGSDTGQLTITIFGTNDAPVALDDSHWTQEGAGAISGNVLVSAAHDGAPDAASRGDVADSDVDGDDLDVSLDGPAVGSYGTLTSFDPASGAYSYQVDNANPLVEALGVGESLTETYSYTVSDGEGGSDTGQLTITIFGTNDAPVALDDSHWTQEGAGAISGNVLVSAAHDGAPDAASRGDVADSDVDGDDLDVSLDGPAVGSYGTLTSFDPASGAYSYQVDNANPLVEALGVGESLTETYSYTVSDGEGGSDTGQLTITIFGTNDAPVALDDSHWTQEGAGAISGNVLVSAAHDGAPDAASRGDVADSDVDGDDLDVSLDGPAVGSYGTLTSFDPASGAYSYQVDNANPLVEALGVGESLTETYSYTVSDGEGGSDTGQLTITIFGTNDAPVALDDSHWTQEGAGAISGNVLVSAAHDGAPDAASRGDVADSDVDGDDLDVSLTGGATGTYGTLTSFDPETGAYTYQVNNANPLVQALGDGETLVETYNYTVSDGNGGSDTATLKITIFGANEAPPTVTVTDLTVNEKGLALGSGEQADFGLGVVVRASNNSDTSEKSSVGSMTIAADAGVAIVEVKNSSNVWIDVSGGTVGSPVIVAGTHGTMAVWSDGAGNYSYQYTLTSNYGTHPDTIVDGDGISGAADPLAGDSFAVRVTDNDSQTSTSTPTAAEVIDITVLDDAPVVYAGPAVLNIVNSGTVSGTANFDFAIGADQRTSYSAANSDFTLPVLTGLVGATAIGAPSVSWASESSTQAVFNFSFTYLSGTTTKTETGTLTLDKATGSYTVDLATPIASFPSISNASAIVGYQDGAANPGVVDATQPMVSVATLTNGVYVQFSGYNDSSADLTAGAAGDYSFAAGDTVTGTRAFVSISGAANGVAGDTMGKAEFLDMDFFTSQPYGNTALAPNAEVNSMFFKFDGIGANEDMVIILKLMDPDDGTLTTKAIYVSNTDIYKQGQIPATSAYSAIPMDNNDGVVIIEPNDYNLLPGENWVIVGAQISATDEGISGSAIDLDRDFGADSTSTATANINNDGNDTGFKISDIGFFTDNTQNAALNFALQLKDSEDDRSAVQNLQVNVVTPVVLDTDGDGAVKYLGREAGVAYDYDGDGTLEATGWAAAGDSILVRDADGTGTVTDASEFVFGHDGLTDLEALQAQYGDQLDAGDADFASFKLWNDANSNGIAEAGELQSLSDAGITGIGLVSDGVASVEAGGDVLVAGNSTYTFVNENGESVTGVLGDAAFVTGADGDEAEQLKTTANSNSVLLGAIAAAGLTSSSMVAAEDHAPAAQSSGDVQSLNGGAPVESSGSIDDGGAARLALHGETRGLVDERPATDASTGNSADVAKHSLTDAEPAQADVPSELSQGTELAIAEPAQSALTSAGVGMPSAEMLAAPATGAGVDGGAQGKAEVGRVIAEALEGGAGGPSIDAVIDAVATGAGSGEAAAAEALASGLSADVPGWDTAAFGGFTDAPTSLTMETMVLHPDAVQAAA